MKKKHGAANPISSKRTDYLKLKNRNSSIMDEVCDGSESEMLSGICYGGGKLKNCKEPSSKKTEYLKLKIRNSSVINEICEGFEAMMLSWKCYDGGKLKKCKESVSESPLLLDMVWFQMSRMDLLRVSTMGLAVMLHTEPTLPNFSAMVIVISLSFCCSFAFISMLQTEPTQTG